MGSSLEQLTPLYGTWNGKRRKFAQLCAEAVGPAGFDGACAGPSDPERKEVKRMLRSRKLRKKDSDHFFNEHRQHMSCLVTHPPNSGSEGDKQPSTIQEAGARKKACVRGRFFSVYHEGVKCPPPAKTCPGALFTPWTGTSISL